MVSLSTIAVLLLHAQTAIAASGCQKDKCYSDVAISKNRKGLAAKQADCRSLLRTVIDDKSTAIVRKYSTATESDTLTFETTLTQITTPTITEATTSTITQENVSTITSTILTTTLISTTETTITVNRRRALSTDVVELSSEQIEEKEKGALAERDIIIVSGTKPSYATNCKNVQQYATACLCYGIKPVTAYAQKTVTSSSTLTSLSTSTTTLQTTLSVSSPTTITETESSTTTMQTSTTTTTTSVLSGASVKPTYVADWFNIDKNLPIVARHERTYALAEQTNDIPQVSITFDATHQPFFTLDNSRKLIINLFEPRLGFLTYTGTGAPPTSPGILCDVDVDGFLQCMVPTAPDVKYFYNCGRATNTFNPFLYLGAVDNLGDAPGDCYSVQLKLGSGTS